MTRGQGLARTETEEPAATVRRECVASLNMYIKSMNTALAFKDPVTEMHHMTKLAMVKAALTDGVDSLNMAKCLFVLHSAIRDQAKYIDGERTMGHYFELQMWRDHGIAVDARFSCLYGNAVTSREYYNKYVGEWKRAWGKTARAQAAKLGMNFPETCMTGVIREQLGQLANIRRRCSGLFFHNDAKQGCEPNYRAVG